MKNKIFVVSGPVAVGKTTLGKKIFELFPELQKGTTYTTREERAGETEDKIMKFITEDEFKQKIENNDFIEWAKVHKYYYGTDKKTLLEELEQSSVLLNIDVQGGLNLAQTLDNVVLIFIQPESLEILKQRLLKRYKGKVDRADYESRLKSIKKELNLAKQYHYQITNKDNQLEKSIQELANLIKSELKS